MAKYTYRLEYQYKGEWRELALYNDVPRTWAEGWLSHHRETPGPRHPFRLVRSDGKVVDETSGKEEVSIGMVAGWPTWQQYVRGSIKAMRNATRVHRRGDMTPEVEKRLTELADEMESLLQHSSS